MLTRSRGKSLSTKPKAKPKSKSKSKPQLSRENKSKRTRQTTEDQDEDEEEDEDEETLGFEHLTEKEKRDEARRLEILRVSSASGSSASDQDEPDEPEEHKRQNAKLSAYAAARTRPLACSSKHLPPPRMCHMSLASLRKISDFLVFATDQDENNKERALRITELTPLANKRWEKLKATFLQRAYATHDLLACDVAGMIMPKILQTKFEVLDALATGASGMALRVYSLERQQNEVLKISQPDIYIYSEAMRKALDLTEFELQRRAVALRLSPQAYEAVQFKAANGVVLEAISMEEMLLNFETAIECAPSQVERLVMAQTLNKFLRLMRRHKVTHGDLHSGNLMLRYNAKLMPELLAIDWARASFEVFRPDYDDLLLVWSLASVFTKANISTKDWIQFLRATFKGLHVSQELKDLWDDEKAVDDFYEDKQEELAEEYEEAIEAAHKPEKKQKQQQKQQQKRRTRKA